MHSPSVSAWAETASAGPKVAIPITSSLVVADLHCSLPTHQLTIVDTVCPFVSSAWLGPDYPKGVSELWFVGLSQFLMVKGCLVS